MSTHFCPTYDSLGRNSGGWVCAGSSQPTCTGGTLQAYGYTVLTVGAQVKQTCDIVVNVCNSFGYDEFNRLTARTVNQGTVQNFTYTYDRYGNRWAQNARRAVLLSASASIRETTSSVRLVLATMWLAI
jgi:YD repeat-containing protein